MFLGGRLGSAAIEPQREYGHHSSSKIFLLANSHRARRKDSPIPSCGLGAKAYEKIQRIARRGFRVRSWREWVSTVSL